MRKFLIVSLIVILIAVSGGTILVISFYKVPELPASSLENARVALKMARDNQAETYASDKYALAIKLYDSALVSWNTENKNFFWKRDYTAVHRLANLSAANAISASHQSSINNSNLQKLILIRLTQQQQLIGEVSVLSRFPLSESIRKQLSAGKLALNECQAALDQGRLKLANQKIKVAENLIEKAHKEAYNTINDYFENFDNWKSWKDQAISESRRNKSLVILIDKVAGVCFVYKNGKVLHEFDVELGKSWIGDKRFKGDQTTPEGKYKVTDKKEGNRTMYHKALLLNYPNDDDKIRFKAEIENGTLSANSKIGNLIEIHGHGGKGADWTDGCVALTNSDMDKLFKLANVGTSVTIIGSSKSLDQLLRKNTQ